MVGVLSFEAPVCQVSGLEWFGVLGYRIQDPNPQSHNSCILEIPKNATPDTLKALERYPLTGP